MNETVCGYEVHPACAMLPMMSQASLEEMAEDIAANGQHQPVITFEGVLLDGRNRLRACEIAGIEPEIREWDGEDPVRWVLSLNFHRRHLSDSQKSVVGARAEELLASRVSSTLNIIEVAPPIAGDGVVEDDAPAARTKKEKLPSPREVRRRARETAAALVNISPKAIARGRKLIDKAVPELVGAVARGTVTLTQATRVAELDELSQRDLVARGDEAIIEEASRIQKTRASKTPSLARALSDLEVLCATLTLEKAVEGTWRLEGTLHDGVEESLELEAQTLKEVALMAWTKAHSVLGIDQ